MRKILFQASILKSVGIHAFVLGVIVFLALKFPFVTRNTPIDIEIIAKKILPEKNEVLAQVKAVHHALQPTPKIDFRPSYMKEAISANHGSRDNSAENKNSVNSGNSALTTLAVPPHVATAFDHLAHEINRNLDYPDLLIEHNVQGTAVLNLHFDQEGKVSETESAFSGSHAAIRGLLVKAARLALVEWYQSDAYRLKRDEFKGQTFHTELSFSYIEFDLENLEKSGPNVYQITRRKFKSECVMPGSVDLMCVALKTKGAVENILSDKSRITFELLKDKLSHYDDIGLNGINELIQGT